MSEQSSLIKEQLSPPPLLRGFGLLIGLIAIPAFQFSIFLTIILILISIFFFFPKRIREVDLKNRSYRVGVYWKSKTFSKWKPFPINCNYISVLRSKHTSTIHTTVGITNLSSTNVYLEFEVNIIFDKRSKFKIGTGASLDEAIELAKKCSNHLKLSIYVVKPGEKYWIEAEI